MKKIVLLFIALMAMTTAEAGRKSDRNSRFEDPNNYEVVTIDVGVEGTKYVKVFAYGKKVEDGIVAAKKAAVTAAIFRGFPGNGAQVMATPALCTDSNARQTHSAYFSKFFSLSGEYLKFVNLTSDGVPSGQDRLKLKGGYKIGLKVQVLYNDLRKKLEQDGIIKGLSSGF